MIRRTPLKRVSSKRARQLKAYSLLRAAFLKVNERCGFPLCEAFATEVHHINKRHGERLNVTEDWVGLCSHHHRWVHDNPSQARNWGLLK